MNSAISPHPRLNGEERQLLRGGPGDIPIVHTLYDTYVLWNEVLEKFPKLQRYTLGESCSRYLLSTLELLLAAATLANQAEKMIKLKEASAKVDTAKLLVRLCKDCKCMTNVQYLKTESKLIDVGKMLGGWIKSAG
ncbi:MAG: hypothetical protein JW384_01031 [Nitrosomonadaceae bacterium]|nr:hypothetical protein [Nitrosomonadaceae bacterium]